MASSKPVTFKNITRAKFLAIRARINAQATSIQSTGDTGTATGDTPLGEVQSSWSYNEATQSLTVIPLKLPFLCSESLFQGKMQALVDSVNG